MELWIYLALFAFGLFIIGRVMIYFIGYYKKLSKTRRDYRDSALWRRQLIDRQFSHWDL